MKIKKVAAIYSIAVGIIMIAQWSFFIVMDQVPELQDEPLRISFHIAAEFLTAIALISGGFGLHLDKKWGFSLFLVAIGMLSYTIVVSPGYYAEKGEIPFVLMFAVLWVITAIFVAFALRKNFSMDDSKKIHEEERTLK